MFKYILLLALSYPLLISTNDCSYIDDRWKWISCFESIISLNNDTLTSLYLSSPHARIDYRDGKFMDMACLHVNMFLVRYLIIHSSKYRHNYRR